MLYGLGIRKWCEMHSDQCRDQVRSLQVSLGDECDREPYGSLCWVSQKARPIPPVPAPDFPTISDHHPKTHRRPQGAAPRRTHSAEGQNGSRQPAARAAKNCQGVPRGAAFMEGRRISHSPIRVPARPSIQPAVCWPLRERAGESKSANG